MDKTPPAQVAILTSQMTGGEAGQISARDCPANGYPAVSGKAKAPAGCPE